ncbi:MAG: hypothetical protein H8E55_66385 [Pelagibacterales bacterium]|nr:hypothetical protein [Pelagibacterales bacterium]
MIFKERINNSSENILVGVFLVMLLVVGVASSELLYKNLYPDNFGNANVFFLVDIYPGGNVVFFHIWLSGLFAALVATRSMWLVNRLFFPDSFKELIDFSWGGSVPVQKTLVWWYFFTGWFLWTFTPIVINSLGYVYPLFIMFDDTTWNVSVFLNIGFTYLLVRNFKNMKKGLSKSV